MVGKGNDVLGDVEEKRGQDRIGLGWVGLDWTGQDKHFNTQDA